MPKFNIDPRYEYLAPRYVGGDCWSCIDDRTYDGAEDSGNRYMIGWGKTQEEALADLERLFEERADYQQNQAMSEAERLYEEEGRDV